MREIKILEKLNHPNIVKLFEVIESPKHINLVMEFIGIKSLEKAIKMNKNKRFPEKDARVIFG